MAAAYPLTSDDESDENLGYVEYYQDLLQWLKTIPLYQLEESVKSDISVLFWLASSREEWMVCLNELGLNHIAIGEIAYASDKWGITPLHVFFNSYHCIEHSISFGDFIEYCLKKEKFHILRHAKCFVKGLFEKSQVSHEPSAPELESAIQNGRRKRRLKRKKENGILLNGLNSSTLNSSQMSLFSLEMHEPSSSVTDERISVFILHPLSKVKYAKKLARLLKDYQIRVVISSDIFHFLRYNHVMILTTLNKKVDFIIPFVCKELLQQIYSKVDSIRRQEDVESIANRFIYTLLYNEVSMKGGLNYRVLPVYRSSEIIDDVRDNLILSWCFKLWNEIPQLVKCLEDTKKPSNHKL